MTQNVLYYIIRNSDALREGCKCASPYVHTDALCNPDTLRDRRYYDICRRVQDAKIWNIGRGCVTFEDLQRLTTKQQRNRDINDLPRLSRPFLDPRNALDRVQFRGA